MARHHLEWRQCRRALGRFVERDVEPNPMIRSAIHDGAREIQPVASEPLRGHSHCHASETRGQIDSLMLIRARSFRRSLRTGAEGVKVANVSLVDHAEPKSTTKNVVTLRSEV